MLHDALGSLERIEKTQSIDPYFVDTAVDFIRVYADRTHHGKEEDQAMLAGFWEFDRKMIHEKYKAVVKDLEAK